MPRIGEKKKISFKRVFILAAVAVMALSLTIPFAFEAFAEEMEKRPIPGWKREASGPWLHSGYGGYDETSNRYNPYSSSPSTSHVLWKRQVDFGGVVGGETGESFFFRGGYPIVFGGRVFYVTGQLRSGRSAEAGGSGYSMPGAATIVCLDQYTGEKIWEQPLPGNASFVSVLQAAFDTSWRGYTMSQTIFVSGNGGIWALDAITGLTTWYINLQNAKIKYVAGTNDLYAMWWEQNEKNRSIVKYNAGEAAKNDAPYALDFGHADPSRIKWTIDKGQPSHIVIEDGVGIYTQQQPLSVKAFNLTSGAILWSRNITWTGPPTAANGKVFVNIADELEFEGGHSQEILALDVHTGQTIWQTNVGYRDSPWFGFGHAIAYGKVFAPSYDGHVYAFDEATGALVWKYFAGENPDYPYGHYPFHMGPAVADGKVFIASEDNAPPQPMIPGNRLYAFNATTGDVIWSFPGAGGGKGQEMAIADGMLFFTDTYTGQMFSFAKGPTAIDVEVKEQTINKDEYVWITGTVTDQSPAQKGAPVVSKESMEAYMAYLHEGFEKPGNTTGVPVSLQATATDGSLITIGTVTSDDTGYFSYKWTPPKEDLYRITATFTEDESYWGSTGTTDLAVGPKVTAPPTQTQPPTVTATPTPSPTPTQTPSLAPSTTATQAPQPPAKGMPVETYIAVAASSIIVIAAAATALILRRRKLAAA